MTLRELLGAPAAQAPPVAVTSLAYDNRAVGPGSVFFCVPGFTRDGHDFAADAVARGAAAVVVERELGDLGVPQIRVPSVREAMAPAAARLAADPTATLRTVGITGTNGKTTTAYLVRALLEAGGCPTGLLGTIEAVVGGERLPAARTTPEAIDLQRTFRAMLDAGDGCCAMEVSSHALDLGRAGAIHWAAAIFTNLTQDHLDFHPTMEDYFRAKRRLFIEQAPAVAIVNVDDPYGAQLAGELGEGTVSFAIDAPDAVLRATDLRADASGTSFTAGGLELRCPLPGRFNVLNALAALAAARALDVPDDVIATALPGAGPVPGRFEAVDEGQGFAVLVDYAHTPDSLDNVLRAARPLAGEGGRVLCVFGAGGDRDRGKRPLMGAVAAALADVVVITSDNPRSEQPSAIVAAIAEGAGDRALIVLDRREAIGEAVAMALPGDVLIIAGKGHEQGQELAGGVKVPFDDVSVAREALRAAAGA